MYLKKSDCRTNFRYKKKGSFTPQLLAQHYDKHENIVFLVPSHGGSKTFWRMSTKKIISGPKTALWGSKKAILGNRGHETARRATKRPPTGKPKVFRVTSGYGGLMIPLSRVRLSPEKVGYVGVALKHRHRRNVTSHHSLSHLSLLHFNFFNFHH